MNHNLEDDLVELEKAIFHHSEVYLSKEVKNESSILDKALSTNSDVPGNINKDKFYDYWTQVVKVSDNVARMLVTGYALQFKNGVIPPSSFINNNKSFLDNSGFGIEEIKRLEKLGCIYRVEEFLEVVPLKVESQIGTSFGFVFGSNISATFPKTCTGTNRTVKPVI